MKKKLGLVFACLCFTAPLVLAKAPESDPGAASGLVQAKAAEIAALGRFGAASGASLESRPANLA